MDRLLYVGAAGAVVAAASWGRVPWRVLAERVLLACAVVALLFFVAEGPGQRAALEAFDAGAHVDPPGGFREDLEVVRAISPSRLLFYTTVFHPDSVRAFLDGLASPTWASVRGAGDAARFTFAQTPVFDPEERSIKIEAGNSAEGPKTSALGITDPTKFTVAFAVRFYSLAAWLGDDPAAAPASTNAQLLHMFGMTEDPADNTLLRVGLTTNNAPPVRLETDGGVQYSGLRLRLKYANEGFVSADIPVATDVTYMFVVTVEQEQTVTVTVRRAAMHTRALVQVARFEVPATARRVTSLTNREIEWNRNGDLEMYMYSFAVFDGALSEAQSEALVNHAANSFSPADTRCPYDSETCYSNDCIGIGDWSEPSALISRPACRARVAAFCKDHPEHPECLCWDPDDGNYDKLKCKLWRAYVEDDPDALLDVPGLTGEQLERIKAHHKLISQETADKAVEAAKAAERAASDKSRQDAVKAESTRLINFYENEPGAATRRGSGEQAEGGVVNYWGDGSDGGGAGETGAGERSRLPRLEDPYENSGGGHRRGHGEDRVRPRDIEEGSGAAADGVSRVRRLRELEEPGTGDAPGGLFNWFRRMVAG